MDDRGIGESIGGDIRYMTTEERAKDIEECIKYLRHRSELDSLRIRLIGLSEGVSISHIIASHDTLIKALVFLSGIGSPGKDVLEYQILRSINDNHKLDIKRNIKATNTDDKGKFSSLRYCYGWRSRFGFCLAFSHFEQKLLRNCYDEE